MTDGVMRVTARLMDMTKVELTAPSVYRLPVGASHLEIYAPKQVRKTAAVGSNPAADQFVRADVELAQGGRHIRIHDVGNVSWFDVPESEASEVYDIIVYNVGWQGTDPKDRSGDAGGHGHGEYVQSGLKSVDTGIFIAGFGLPGKFYATETDKLHGLRRRRVIYVGEMYLVGGVAFGADDVEFDDCSFLDCRLTLGYTAPNGSVAIRGCLMAYADKVPGGAVVIGGASQRDKTKSSWEQVTFTGNTVIGGMCNDGKTPNRAMSVINATPEAMKAWEVDSNTYYSANPYPFNLNGRLLTFEQWKNETGFDQHSTLIAGEPDAPILRVYPVPEMNAANVAVVNSSGALLVSLPEKMGKGLLRDVRNYDAPYTGNVLMMDGKVAPPLNWDGSPTDPPLARATLPRYGVFRVEMSPEPVETEDQKTIRELQGELAVLQRGYDALGLLANAQREQIATLTDERNQAVLHLQAKTAIANAQAKVIADQAPDVDLLDALFARMEARRMQDDGR